MVSAVLIGCAECNREISRKPSDIRSEKAFCSLACAGKHHRKRRILPCANCGIAVERRPSDLGNGLIFCSRSCAAQLNNQRFHKRKRRFIGTCLACGKDFNQSRNRRFCSRACFRSTTHRHIRTTPSPRIRVVRNLKPCATCGTTVKSHLSTYCSAICTHKAQRAIRYARARTTEPRNVFKTDRTLKIFLIQKRGHRCEICGITEWMKQKAPLVLDHINGYHYDNTESNLRLVCSNCDAQLPTYKSKNRGRGDPRRRARYYAEKSGGSGGSRTPKAVTLARVQAGCHRQLACASK